MELRTSSNELYRPHGCLKALPPHGLQFGPNSLELIQTSLRFPERAFSSLVRRSTHDTHSGLVNSGYMLRGIWVRFDDFDDAPLADYLQASDCLSVHGRDGNDAATAMAALAGSLVYVQLEKAEFNIPVHLPDGSDESVSVVCWQFPLTHAVVRTAMSSRGLTLPGGVVADLRRTGGMKDDIWWLNVYVILSRATRIDHLLLLGLGDNVKSLLERGPPPYAPEKIKQLRAKAVAAEAAVEHLARKLRITLPK